MKEHGPMKEHGGLVQPRHPVGLWCSEHERYEIKPHPKRGGRESDDSLQGPHETPEGPEGRVSAANPAAPDKPRWWRIEVEPRIERIGALEADLRDARIDAEKERSLTEQHAHKEKRLEAELAAAKNMLYLDGQAFAKTQARAEKAEVELAQLKKRAEPLFDELRETKFHLKAAEARVAELEAEHIIDMDGVCLYNEVEHEAREKGEEG